MQESLCVHLLVLWLNFIIQAVPARLAATFTELLIGAVPSQSGHINDALYNIVHRKHHTTYYWMLTTGKWSALQLNQRLIDLILVAFPRFDTIIDDYWRSRVSSFVLLSLELYKKGLTFKLYHLTNWRPYETKKTFYS